MNHKNYTLTEILVTIGIIALLCAILFPVFFTARENTRKISCVSNLKQISQVFMQYNQDYDGFYPNTEYWILNIIPYIESKNLKCPSFSTKKEIRDSIKKQFVGYSYNTRIPYVIVNNIEPSRPAGDFEILFPSTTVMVFDQSAEFITSSAPDMTKYTNPNVTEKGWIRHLGGANYAFCDGHVKWFTPEQVLPAVSASTKNDGTKPTFAVLEKPS